MIINSSFFKIIKGFTQSLKSDINEGAHKIMKI